MNKKKPTIIVTSRNLPPLVGGMERLNWHLIDSLTNNHDVIVTCPRGSKTPPHTTKQLFVPLRPLSLFLIITLLKTIYQSLKTKPTYIIAGSGLTAPIAYIAAKISGGKSVAYLHGLDITVDSSLYRCLWHPFIKRIDIAIANSSDTANSIKRLNIAERKLSVINPGVSITYKTNSSYNLEQFKKQFNLLEKNVLLSVGRLAERKGIMEFVQFSLPHIVAKFPNTQYLIIGSIPANSLHANPQTPESILSVAQKLNVEKNIQFLGTVSEEVLECAYRSAHAHVFPVKEIQGDPEGFGMVAIEAASFGLPTVAFATGGIVDAIEDGFSGHLISPNNYLQFTAAVLSILEFPCQLSNNCIEFSNKFSWSAFQDKLNDVLGEQQPL